MEDFHHIPSKRVQALVRLLEDPNEIVYEAVYQALVKENISVVPVLLEAWETMNDELVRQRIDKIVRCIEWQSVVGEMIDWLNDGAEDLVYGAYLVAKYQYTDVEYSSIKNQINACWRELKEAVNNADSPRDKVKVVNEYLFERMAFSKNHDEPFSHRNNCINDVLETRKGNHVSLSILYSAICQKAGMPVYCVSLPRTVIVCYLDHKADIEDVQAKDVLFYMNPACEGRLLSMNDISNFLDNYGMKKDIGYYLPCDNAMILNRLLTNMLYSLKSIKCDQRVEELEKTLDMLGPFFEKYNI